MEEGLATSCLLHAGQLENSNWESSMQESVKYYGMLGKR